MKEKMLILAILLVGLIASFLYAEDNPNPTQFLPPESINPYTFKLNMGHISPSEDYVAKGNNSYQQQRYENAAQYYLAQLQYDPHNKNVLYNLARCYSMLNKPDLASYYLMQSGKCGFVNVRHIRSDKDFDKIRKTPVFVATMDSLNTLHAQRSHTNHK